MAKSIVWPAGQRWCARVIRGDLATAYGAHAAGICGGEGCVGLLVSSALAHMCSERNGWRPLAKIYRFSLGLEPCEAYGIYDRHSMRFLPHLVRQVGHLGELSRRIRRHRQAPGAVSNRPNGFQRPAMLNGSRDVCVFVFFQIARGTRGRTRPQRGAKAEGHELAER